MTLKVLSGFAQEVSQQKYQYYFSLEGQEVVLTSKINSCVNEGDELTVVGYFFNDDRQCGECPVLGVISYQNHSTGARSDHRIPVCIFILSLLLNIVLVLYSFHLYLLGGINYYVVLFITVFSIVSYLGYLSTSSHLILRDYLKKNSYARMKR